MTGAELAGLLSEPARLRVFAALALGATTRSELAARTQLDSRSVNAALHRLKSAGLVSTVDGQLVLHTEVIRAARQGAVGPTPTGDPELDSVLRIFVRDDVLREIPANRAQRMVVLKHVVQSFEIGVRYPERAVNDILRRWHADVASLRRFLVDEQLLARAAREYRRIDH